MKKVLCLLTLLTAACSTSDKFESPRHDFTSQAVKTQQRVVVGRKPTERPDLKGSLEVTKKRFSRAEELRGILDKVAQNSLSTVPWTDHPTIVAKRNQVKAALNEYDQARELNDLLDTYRAFENPAGTDIPIIAPHVESIRGKMADLNAEAAWYELRASLVAVAASIFEKQANVTYIEAQVKATQSHLDLIDELIPVVRARTTTGRSRQADLLTIRSERSAVDARLAAFREQRAAAEFELKQAANAETDLTISIPQLAGKMQPLDHLIAVALAQEPLLQAMKSKLARRHQGLRLANLKASETAQMPGGGVRAAIRREMEDNIRVAEAGINSAKVRLSNSLARARAAIIAARAEESALEKQSVPDARQSLEDLRASYGGRRASFLDVFRAARRRLDVELNLARSTHEKTRAETSLFRSLARRQP